jgi:rubrerythrin
MARGSAEMNDNWGNPDADPKQDLIDALNKEPVYEPPKLLMTQDQTITLRAIEIYEKWKAAWRKRHPILSFIEKVLDRIKNPKYHCKSCGLTYKNPESARDCYDDCLREYGG